MSPRATRPAEFQQVRLRVASGMGEAVVRTAGLSGEGEVVHAGDAEHGVMDAVALQAAVAEVLRAAFTSEGHLSYDRSRPRRNG